MLTSGPDAAVRLSLVAILLLAAALRFAGIGYGLPAVFNPDEVAIMNRALALATGDLNPHNFLYPSFYFYVLFAWEGAFFLVAHLAGVFDSLTAFERRFFIDPSPIYLAGRALTALLGVLTVGATWRLGARLFGSVSGLIGALLLAVAPLAVIDAHYVKHDVPVTLLIVLAHLALVDLVLTPDRRQDRWRWIVAGSLAGLAMSTHYYAVFLIVPVSLAALTPVGAGDSWRARWSVLALASLGAAAGFFAGSPFLLVEPATAIRDVLANREIVIDRATAATGVFGSLGFYVTWLAGGAAGPIAFAAAMAGLVIAIVRGWPTALLLLAFPLAFLLFIANTFPATRYLNPVLPFVAVLAGASIGWFGRHRGAARPAAAAIAAAAVLHAGAASARAGWFFRQDDTRTLAQQWIEREVPPGASVVVQPYSVVLHSSRAALVEALDAHLGSADRASIKFQRQLALDPYPAPAYRVIYLGAGGLDADKIYVAPAAFTDSSGLAPLRALGIDYLVLKRFEAPDPTLAALGRALEREAERLATFSPCRPDRASAPWACVRPFIHNTDARIDPALERPGPVIEIWKVR